MQGDVDAADSDMYAWNSIISRMRMATVKYDFMHYYVRLEEGRPPKDYWAAYNRPFNQHKMLEEWVATHRERKPDFY